MDDTTLLTEAWSLVGKKVPKKINSDASFRRLLSCLTKKVIANNGKNVQTSVEYEQKQNDVLNKFKSGTLEDLNEAIDALEQVDVEEDLGAEINEQNEEMETNEQYLQTLEEERELIIDTRDDATDVDIDEQLKRIEAPKFLNTELFPHQKVGFKFMHDSIAKGKGGCILADYMGLGKTLQVACFLHHYLKFKPNANILLLAPTSVLEHWAKEFSRVELWSHDEVRFFKMTTSARMSTLSDWWRFHGILLISYDTYRAMMRKGLVKIHEKLCSPGPTLIVLDEGHRIKNSASNINKLVSAVDTHNRILITGYPLQNNLIEYWAMINFARPGFLGPLTDYKIRFVNPIRKGENGDAVEKLIARSKAAALHEKVKELVIRRDATLLKKDLPRRQDFIIHIPLSNVQKTIYKGLIDGLQKELAEQSHFLFWLYDVLVLLCNHPNVLKDYHQNKLVLQENKVPRPVQTGEFVDPDDITHEELDDIAVEESVSDSESKSSSKYLKESEIAATALLKRVLGENEEALNNLGPEGKVVILFQILFRSKEVGDRVVVFSRSLDTLAFIKATIDVYNTGSEKPINYLEFDGSTKQTDRQLIVDAFNGAATEESKNPFFSENRYDVMLISTLAGGEGINLLGANRVVLMDVNWNPSSDNEACCRVYRFGQKKPVYIYRLVTTNTIEDKVLARQLQKEVLSAWVIDNNDKRVTDHVNPKTLFENPAEPAEVGPIVDAAIDDDIIRRLLARHSKWINRIDLHESLVSVEQEKPLSDEEQQKLDRMIQATRKREQVFGEREVEVIGSSSEDVKEEAVPVLSPKRVTTKRKRE